MKQPPRALLKFSAVLEASTHDSLPYPVLKRLLRYLKAVHPAYPRRVYFPNAPPICSLSQTQKDETENHTTRSLCMDENIPNDVKAQTNGNTNPFGPPQAGEEPCALSQDTEETLSLKCCLSPVRSTEDSVALIEEEKGEEEAEKESDSALYSTSTSSLSSHARKRMRLEEYEPHDHTPQGPVINEALWELAHENDKGVVTWGQLRQQIAIVSDLFEIFCKRMDDIFEQHDIVATNNLEAPCVFYSCEFWEAAWNGFCNLDDRSRNSTKRRVVTQLDFR